MSDSNAHPFSPAQREYAVLDAAVSLTVLISQTNITADTTTHLVVDETKDLAIARVASPATTAPPLSNPEAAREIQLLRVFAQPQGVDEGGSSEAWRVGDMVAVPAKLLKPCKTKHSICTPDKGHVAEGHQRRPRTT